MKVLMAIAMAFLLCGCLGNVNPNPLNQPVTAKAYDNLNPRSYGELSLRAINYCDELFPGDPLESALKEGGKDIMGQIYKPIGGATVYDETVVKEELQDQFRAIGNIFQANVVIIKRDMKTIFFWYDRDHVSDQEIAMAAKKYCGIHGKNYILLGSARRCGPTTVVPGLIKINGQSTPTKITPTYVIAGFSCG